ncbi:hypothetical protein AK812_SmicGene22239 [Symbiodinium microadriaticum]|uniref:Uncharacterized protein n=1 Tax=Symbiodinium microadriaticum TaxID=2951 RepID=A0A1Q9DKB8_SYMMI|nr:hypothetical protein AK812_SmicGene22239 [Symbiodinium microadriaticum]
MPDDDEIGDGDDCEMVDGDDGEEILKDLESEQGSSESDDSTELQKLVDAARALSCSGSEPEADEPNPPPADGDESPPAELPKRNKRSVPQVDVVPSQFHAGGQVAVDIGRVQRAALDSAGKEILTPQQQLELLKNDRASKKKPGKPAGSRDPPEECLEVFASGWMKATSAVQANKMGFVEGEEAPPVDEASSPAKSEGSGPQHVVWFHWTQAAKQICDPATIVLITYRYSWQVIAMLHQALVDPGGIVGLDDERV